VPKDLNKAYAWMKLAVDSEIAKEQEKKTFDLIASKITDKGAAEKEYQRLKSKYSTSVLLDTLYPELVQVEKSNAFEAEPIKISEPRYPRDAAMKGLTGQVKFKFDLDKKGVPRNIQLVQALPDRTFVKPSVKAIRKWRFKPAQDEQGSPVESFDLRYTMEYKLDTGGLSIKQDYLEKTRKNAKAGDSRAQYSLGILYKTLSELKDQDNPNDWFTRAAVQGHPAAQYELGRNLVRGQGCRVDKAKGLEWLSRSAANGVDQAAETLGLLAYRNQSIEDKVRALEYFKQVDKLTPYAQIKMAWLLATSTEPEIADPKRAIAIIDDLDQRLFWDEATQYQIKAAAYAALGNYEKAVDLQEDALDEAEDMDAYVDEIKSHLASYKQRTKWF